MRVILSIAPFAAAAVFALIIYALLPPLQFIGSWIVGVSIASFFTYSYDKSIAGHGVTRVPEIVLHALTLFGGTLGSFAAMRLWHHKTSKQAFQAVFWAIVVIQIVAIVLLATR